MSVRGRLAAVVLAAALPVPAAESAPPGAFQGWVPPGWKLLRTASGDLDGDGRADAVLVLEKDDPANRKPNASLGAPEINLNPRRLLVLFAGERGWREGPRTDRFLPTEGYLENPCQLDPLVDGDVKVVRGTLRIDLHYWLSCGSYGVAHNTFTFRLEGGRLRLIGLDTLQFMRNSGESSRDSVNFLTGRAKSTTGDNMFEPSSPRVQWRRVDHRVPIYLDEMSSECLVDGKPQRWCR
ncbi:MAG TPA: hypothetical protein VFK48_03170 [Usitatibacter sp.]|nr:hypothetical protein [Usitatibacter sp.]